MGLVCLITFFYAIGAHDLWGPDEVRYALVAREMAERGDYIVPHLNGEVYLEKPPLVFWLTNVFAQGLHFPYETAARLPAAFASLITVLLVWAYASRRWDGWTGLLAGLLLVTNPTVFWFGRSGMLDSVLTLATTVATLAGVHALDTRSRWLPWFGLVGAGLAAAALTKGPVGFLVPLLVIGSYGIATHRGRRAAVGLGLSGALAVLCVLPWWIAAHSQSGGQYGSMSELWHQTYGRAVQGYSHAHSVYYYVLQLLPGWLPWSLFLPGAVWTAAKTRGRPDWAAWRLPVFWAVLPFVALSLIVSKRERYLLPLYPGVALMLALYLRQFVVESRPLVRIKAIRIPVAILAGAMVAGAVALPIALPWVPPEYAVVLPPLRTAIVPAALGAVALVGLLVVTGGTRPPIYALAVIGVLTTLLFAVTAAVALPLGDRSKSAKTFAHHLHLLQEEGGRLILFDSFRADVGFYLHQPVTVMWPPEESLRVLPDHPETLGLIRKKHFDQLPAFDAGGPLSGLDILYSTQVGSKTWYVVRSAVDSDAQAVPADATTATPTALVY